MFHNKKILYQNPLQYRLIVYEFRIRRSRKSSRRDLNIIINRETILFGHRLKSLRGPTFEYLVMAATTGDFGLASGNFHIELTFPHICSDDLHLESSKFTQH